MKASWDDEIFQQDKSMLAQEQLKKLVDEWGKDCALKEKELTHKKQLAHLQDGESISQKSDISSLSANDSLFPGVPFPDHSNVEKDLSKVQSECKKKDEEIQALREGIDSDTGELDTAEHLDTSQRAPAQAPDEIDSMRKKLEDLRSEIAGLNNQLDSLRSSDSDLPHQVREPASQLVSNSEKIKQLNEELQVLGDKHRKDMSDVDHETECIEDELGVEKSKVCTLKQDRRMEGEKVDNIQAQFKAIFDEVIQHDRDMSLSELEDLNKRMRGTFPAHIYKGHKVTKLVERVIVQYQREMEAKTWEMDKRKKKVAKIRQQTRKTRAEIKWHESHFEIDHQMRARLEQYVEGLLLDITSGDEVSDEESAFSSRGGSTEGSQVSLSGEEQTTFPSRRRECKHRTEQEIGRAHV